MVTKHRKQYANMKERQQEKQAMTLDPLEYQILRLPDAVYKELQIHKNEQATRDHEE
jgi:hypothetical protein